MNDLVLRMHICMCLSAEPELHIARIDGAGGQGSTPGMRSSDGVALPQRSKWRRDLKLYESCFSASFLFFYPT